MNLAQAWEAIEALLATRPYPGFPEEGPGGWGLQLYGYPEGPDPMENRYHAMATPIIDSHHRNTIIATGPNPVTALLRLRDKLMEETNV